jgi:hypothetical protein
MSSLGYYEGDKWIHQCGATLISSKHFLTAAHCIKSDKEQKLHVGDFNLSLSKPQQLGIDVDIMKINVHPLYNYSMAYFDIAIIVSNSINFTDNIQPLCLPEYSSTDVHKYDRDQVDLLGWGASSFKGLVSETLKKVSQTIFPQKYCNKTHTRHDTKKKHIQQVLPALFQSHLICAGTDLSSQGACTGDSGGPLQFYDFDNNRYQQVGVVHGSVSDCGLSEFPGIYARLDDPTIFNFLKSATQEASFDSSESDLHLLLLPNYEKKMALFNWRTNVLCYAEIFSYFQPLQIAVLNSTLIFCGRVSKYSSDATCAQYSKVSKKWENTATHSHDYYERGTIVPNIGWVMFRADAKENREYIKILDNPDGEWRDGPELPYTGEIDSGCILQLNDTTTFTLKKEYYYYVIKTFDWSSHNYTEYQHHLANVLYITNCVQMKDENGDSLVAIVYTGNDYRIKMIIWNPADDSIKSEAFPVQRDYLSPALAAIDGGRDLLFYPNYHVSEKQAVILKYNLASRTWKETGVFLEMEENAKVFQLDGFTFKDFNCTFEQF